MIPEKLTLLIDPDTPPDGMAMEFKLTYEGQLLGASRDNTRAKHKHDIRRKFHPQLRRLWEIAPALTQREYLSNENFKSERTPYKEWLPNQFQRCGYRFCPLITDSLFLRCNLQILFLRADPPGSIIKSGDLDNRLKTLFDALRMPKDAGELGGYSTPLPDEDPFFCLLEDDRAISNLSVETATLLEPSGDHFDVNDARLVISVKLWAWRVVPNNIDFM